MSKLHVIIIGSPVLGGSGIMAGRIAAGLAERDHDVTFLSYDVPRRSTEGVRYETTAAKKHALFPFELRENALAERIYELCTKKRIDVVHVHYALFFGQAALQALEALPSERRPRLIITCHGTDIIDGSPAQRALVASLLKRADVVTAVSGDLAGRIENEYGPIRVSVIPNFTDTPMSARVRTGSRPRRIVHASNFRPIKQPQLVVEAVQALDGSSELALVGDGPLYKDTVAHAVRVLGADRVFAYGQLDEESTLRRIAEASVVMIPSRYESFSLCALEAQVCGVPVVGTTGGGMNEVIENGVTGLLLDPSATPSQWADALRAAMALPNVYARSRQSANKFSKLRILQTYEVTYRRVFSAARNPMPWILCG